MTRLFLIILFCTLCLGCSGEDDGKIVSTNEVAQVVKTNQSANIVDPINMTDYTLISLNGEIEYMLFEDIYKEINNIATLKPEVLYKDSYDDDYTRLKSQSNSIHIEWLKGPGTILRVLVNEPDFVTRRGVKVGDSVDVLNLAYGIENGYRSKDRIEFDLGNQDAEAIMALVFYIENSMIVQIEITQGT